MNNINIFTVPKNIFIYPGWSNVSVIDTFFRL